MGRSVTTEVVFVEEISQSVGGRPVVEKRTENRAYRTQELQLQLTTSPTPSLEGGASIKEGNLVGKALDFLIGRLVQDSSSSRLLLWLAIKQTTNKRTFLDPIESNHFHYNPPLIYFRKQDKKKELIPILFYLPQSIYSNQFSL